jgi:hypothetical protein
MHKFQVILHTCTRHYEVNAQIYLVIVQESVLIFRLYW